jgi:hypothetical protein
VYAVRVTTDAAAPFTDMHCVYVSASGPRYSDCTFIGRRHRDAYGSNATDSDFWILVNRPENTQDGLTYMCWGPWTNYITSLWRSSSGIVYVADVTAKAVDVFTNVMDKSSGERRDALPFWPEGVWGLDDEHVYTWGSRKDAAGKLECGVARYDGRNWTEIEAPGFAVISMHGIAPDLIYACGYHGGMARWDGGSWTTFPMPTAEVLSDVFVAGPDEMYATGMNGALLEGSRNGWHVITRTMDERLPFTCVAKWHDQLWVGGGPLGLFRRIGKTDQLECVRQKIFATSFDAREDLVITAETMIAGTSEGTNFRASGINSLMQMTGTIDISLR